MGLFDRLFKKSVSANDTQTVEGATFSGYIHGMTGGYNVTVDPLQAYKLHQSVAPLADAVGDISGPLASLWMGFRDSNGEETYEHPALSFLRSPSEGYPARRWWKELSNSYLLVSESWPVLRGNINRAPLAKTFVRSYDLDVTYATDGLPSMIRTTGQRDKKEYKRIEQNGVFRFVTDDQLNEIIPILGDASTADQWRGVSRLSALLYDLKQSRDGKRHNAARLKNGLTKDMVISPKKDRWSPKSIEQMQDGFRANHQGAGNAGGILISPEPFDLYENTLTNKDMDYANLLRANSEAIYNAFNIPLPLVTSDSMTLDNFTVAQKALYTNAVFPMFEEITDPIMQSLIFRFPDLEGSQIVADELQISALRGSRIEDVLKLSQADVISTNEKRAEIGYQPVSAGDDILVSSAKVPLGEPIEGFTDGIEEEPDPADE